MKTFLFQAIQLNQTVLIHTIQFSISIVFVYTQLNVKTVPFQRIQFSVSTFAMSKTVLFQTIQFSIQKQFHFKQFCLAQVCSLNVKTVLFQEIQLSISTQFTSIWHINRTLSGATTSGQSGPGSDGNEGVLCISQSSSIAGTSPWDCFESYPGHLLWGVSPLFRDAVSVFYSLNWGRFLNCHMTHNVSI